MQCCEKKMLRLSKGRWQRCREKRAREKHVHTGGDLFIYLFISYVKFTLNWWISSTNTHWPAQPVSVVKSKFNTCWLWQNIQHKKEEQSEIACWVTCGPEGSGIKLNSWLGVWVPSVRSLLPFHSLSLCTEKVTCDTDDWWNMDIIIIKTSVFYSSFVTQVFYR